MKSLRFALVVVGAFAIGCGAPDAPAADTSDVTASSLDVELKVTVREDQVDLAIDALGLDDGDAEVRDVWFYDTPELDLDAAGIVLRARKVKDGPDDSTVKLRPMSPSKVAKSWFSVAGFKCETDRTATKSVVACSLTTTQDTGEIDDVADGVRDLEKLYSKEQESFLDKYSSFDGDFGALSALGPVDALVWKLETKSIPSGLTVELWTLPDGTRILEVSTRTSSSKASSTATKLKKLLEGMGLDASGQDETKTRAALDYFAAAAQ